ncbi:hypothetical protein J2X27_002291 [Staphylococcus epidermidis]|nr:hypothetical protein [Staphylococcus epidermidis]
MGRELFLSVVFLVFIFIVLIFSDYIFLNEFYYFKNTFVSIAITIFIMCMIEKSEIKINTCHYADESTVFGFVKGSKAQLQ